MINPWIALAALVLWVASVVGSIRYGVDVGTNTEKARQADIKQVIEDTRKAANQGAADAISKIAVHNTTVQGRVDTIIRDNPVYRDCVHDPEQLRLINAALGAAVEPARPAGGGELPAAQPAR